MQKKLSLKKKKAVVKKAAAPVPRKTAMVAAVVQKEVRKNTRAEAIDKIVKAIIPKKAVVIKEIPISQNRRSQRNKK